MSFIIESEHHHKVCFSFFYRITNREVLFYLRILSHFIQKHSLQIWSLPWKSLLYIFLCEFRYLCVTVFRIELCEFADTNNLNSQKNTHKVKLDVSGDKTPQSLFLKLNVSTVQEYHVLTCLSILLNRLESGYE